MKFKTFFFQHFTTSIKSSYFLLPLFSVTIIFSYNYFLLQLFSVTIIFCYNYFLLQLFSVTIIFCFLTLLFFSLFFIHKCLLLNPFYSFNSFSNFFLSFSELTPFFCFLIIPIFCLSDSLSNSCCCSLSITYLWNTYILFSKNTHSFIKSCFLDCNNFHLILPLLRVIINNKNNLNFHWF